MDFLQLVAKKTDEGFTSNAERKHKTIRDYPSSVTFGDSSSSEELFTQTRLTMRFFNIIIFMLFTDFINCPAFCRTVFY